MSIDKVFHNGMQVGKLPYTMLHIAIQQSSLYIHFDEEQHLEELVISNHFCRFCCNATNRVRPQFRMAEAFHLPALCDFLIVCFQY